MLTLNPERMKDTPTLETPIIFLELVGVLYAAVCRDAGHPTGPFVLFAGFAFIVLLWAWSLLRSGVDAREVVV